MSLNLKDSELNKFTDQAAVRVAGDDLSLRYDQASSSVLYLAEGLFGALESEPKWKIKKIEITNSSASIKCASNKFDQTWNDRASLTYV